MNLKRHMDIDFLKYKRFFTFGCSYTSYQWPTWANILAKEMPNAEFYNFGKSGAGNVMIACRVGEAAQRFTFCETDLVMVMWSSFCREDRWIEGDWRVYGNIFNQSFYSEDWVKKYADPIGYLIRDLPLIEMTNTFLTTLPCDSIKLKSTELTFLELAQKLENDSNRNNLLETIYKTYHLSYEKMPTSLATFTRTLPRSTYYYIDADNKKMSDGHPTPTDVCNYLRLLGISISETTEIYAAEYTNWLKKNNRAQEIRDRFNHTEITQEDHKRQNLLF